MRKRKKDQRSGLSGRESGGKGKGPGYPYSAQGRRHHSFLPALRILSHFSGLQKHLHACAVFFATAHPGPRQLFRLSPHINRRGGTPSAITGRFPVAFIPSDRTKRPLPSGPGAESLPAPPSTRSSRKALEIPLFLLAANAASLHFLSWWFPFSFEFYLPPSMVARGRETTSKF
jgi:hypothetical protein